ncbi:MAG TPA: hypothetical protein VMJ10_10490 [Kofleriaceae bacterium]|nr:hypothetical protein [Kofleriaceae bacterium]
MTKHLATILAVLVFASAGCGGKKDDGAPSASGKTAEKAGGSTSTKLDQLGGLTIDFAGSVGKAIGGDGVMIQGDNGIVTIEEVKAPKKVEDAKSDADMYSPKNYKEEKLADGYALTYENSGSMGANYFVDVQRTIAGKTYHCSTTGNSADQQQAVLAACKSLKK